MSPREEPGDDEPLGGGVVRAPWLRLGCALGGFTFVGVMVARADLAKVSSALAGAPALALLALLPFPLALTFDALAWTRLLRRLGADVGTSRAFVVRLASEAFGNVVPMAGLASETVGPALLSNVTGVPLPKAVASSAAKRWLVARSHATYVLGCVLLPLAGAHAARFVPAGLCLAVAFGLFAASAAVQLVAGHSRPATRLFAVLRRVPWLGARLEKRGHAFGSVDESLATLSRAITPDAWALVVAAWIMEGTETYLLLRAVGIDVGYLDAVALDGVMSALRSSAVFVPAGLGVQDAGFAYFLGPSVQAEAAAFVLLKRSKELLYVALGLAVFFVLQGRGSLTASKGTA